VIVLFEFEADLDPETATAEFEKCPEISMDISGHVRDIDV
jgi:hypothetical protein